VRVHAKAQLNRGARVWIFSDGFDTDAPDALPAGLPQDPFSGEPFQYEKTASGFTLRCAGKDLDKNEPYTFEYGVKK